MHLKTFVEKKYTICFKIQLAINHIHILVLNLLKAFSYASFTAFIESSSLCISGLLFSAEGEIIL